MKYNFNIEEIKEQVAEVIKESQGFYSMDLKVDKIIEDWLKAKEFFIEKLNGNLIYETEEFFSFTLGYKSKKDRLNKFAELVSSQWKNEALGDFLYGLELEDFYNNMTSREYNTNYYKEILIPKNFKVVKAFKFFVEDPAILKDIQNEASRIIQENIVRGHLCFSVHPLDFLSASENVHNWRSCHALDGEYRSGNLNYLMDSSTVICYLKAEKPAILPHFPISIPWNSKKWRVWFHFSNDKSMLFAGRQYPFSNDNGINYIKDKILPNIGLGHWGNFNSHQLRCFSDETSGDYFCFESHIPVGQTLKPLKKLVVNGPMSYMFNDILQSTCYTPLYSYYENDLDSLWSLGTGLSNDKTKFTIGEKCACPICGEYQIDFQEIMACRKCAGKYQLEDSEDYGVCEKCGASVFYEDLYYLEISDMYVCENCYQNETRRCQNCDVIDLPDVIQYYNGLYLCPNCIEQEKNKPKNIIF